MEAPGVTDITLTVGNLPENPGMSMTVDLSLGDNNTAAVKSSFQAKAGSDFEEYRVYAVLQCASAESAAALKERLSTLWSKAMSGEATDMIAAQLKGMVKPDDDEDALFTLDFTTNADNLIVKVIPNDEKHMTAESVYTSMIEESAGHLLAHDQKIHLELDIGNSIGSILHSEIAPLEALDSLKVNVNLGLKSELAGQIAEVLGNFGIPNKALTGLQVFGLYQHAKLNLKFRSAKEVPDGIKNFIKGMGVTAFISGAKNMIPDEVKPLIEIAMEHARSELLIVGGAGKIMAEVKVHAPGLSEFYQFN